MGFWRSICAVTMLTTACNGGATPTPAGVALTHQWSTKSGTSLFVQSSLGTAPEAAADPLMAVMPTVVHQLGERCRSNKAAATPGVFSLAFALEHGEVSDVTSDPSTPLAECVIGAVPAVMKDQAKALAEIPTARVVLYLEHAPMAADVKAAAR